MQPYVNPNYFGQMPNYQQTNPYMDRFNQLQQYQQNLQQNQIQPFSTLGKIVESVDIVKSTDIPMDGNLYYFPKADGTEIYAKRWLANGQTQILAFKPVLEEKATNSTPNGEKLKLGLSDEATEIFMARFDDIVDRMDRLERSIKPATRKKEVSADE